MMYGMASVLRLLQWVGVESDVEGDVPSFPGSPFVAVLKCSARWNSFLGFVSFFRTPRITSSKVTVACFLFSTVRFTTQKSMTFFKL